MSTANDEKRQEIMQNVKKTCTSLAAKFEQLHHQVFKPVEQAKEAVVNTIGTVTDTVSSAKHVVETVGEQVAKRPWMAIFGSIAAGVGAGLLTRPSSPSSEPSSSPFTGHAAVTTGLPEQPSFFSKQINKLTSVAVGAGLAVVRDLVKDQMPAWADAADAVANDLTEQFGAVPFAGSILQPSHSETVSAI